MTERSLYPDRVEVKSDDLNYTEDTKSEQLRQRLVDLSSVVRAGVLQSQGGVVEGLRVTRNAVATSTVDVSPGTAYSPNGEYIEVDTTQLQVALSDYTDGLANFLCLTYTEVETTPAPHETDGTARNTRTEAAFLLRAYTQAELDALPATSTDITATARDRLVVLANCPGNGLTGSTPNALVEAEFEQQDEYVEVVTAAYPSAGIRGINPVTANTVTLGEGTLSLDVVSNTTKNLSYAAAGDTAGASTNVAGTTGQVTLTSNDGSSTLTVDVEEALLPVAVATYNAAVNVDRLYEPTGRMFSAADRELRRTAGSVGATSDNPQGAQLSDLAPEFLRMARSLLVGSGLISSEDDASTAQLQLHAASGLGGETRTLLGQVRLDAGGGYWRLYHDQDDASLTLSYNARHAQNTANNWVADDGTDDAWRVDFGNNRAFTWAHAPAPGAGTFSFPGAVGEAGDGLNTPTVLLRGDDVSTSVIPALTLSSATALLGSTNNDKSLVAVLERLALFATEKLRVFTAQQADVIVAGGVTYVITYNADYDSSTALYTADDTADEAWAIEMNDDFIRVLRKLNTAVPWARAAWDDVPFAIDTMGAAGNVTAGGLVVTNDASIGNNLNVTGTGTIATLNVTGTGTIATLNATGPATMGSTLDVTGLLTVTNGVNCTDVETQFVNLTQDSPGTTGRVYRDMVAQARATIQLTGNGTATPGTAITQAINVSSVTFPGSNIARVNFANSLSGGDYQVWITIGDGGSAGGAFSGGTWLVGNIAWDGAKVGTYADVQLRDNAVNPAVLPFTSLTAPRVVVFDLLVIGNA